MVVRVDRRARAARSPGVAITSLAFMLDEVPEPVWKTSIGNSSSCSPAGDLVGGRRDRVGDRRVDDPELGVDRGRGGLDAAPARAMCARLEPLPGDREVLDRALGLRPPLGARRAPAPRPWSRARSGTPARTCRPSRAAARTTAPLTLRVLQLRGRVDARPPLERGAAASGGSRAPVRGPGDAAGSRSSPRGHPPRTCRSRGVRGGPRRTRRRSGRPGEQATTTDRRRAAAACSATRLRPPGTLSVSARVTGHVPLPPATRRAARLPARRRSPRAARARRRASRRRRGTRAARRVRLGAALCGAVQPLTPATTPAATASASTPPLMAGSIANRFTTRATASSAASAAAGGGGGAAAASRSSAARSAVSRRAASLSSRPSSRGAASRRGRAGRVRS